ncbi:ATP-binding cassette domain-containing protein [Spiroplasma endosymbiont of Crioceris asparagi]|uniref:ATP-binding cassette domain-containing protein n=1 Tax=Spiroplasma endosymbiont of Crioceris asparagi TaxID=3066286 RepID=UPI0030CF8C6D
MKNNVAISSEQLNKLFKSGYGVFDANFDVEYGKVFGYLGPNGAGKSTTIRMIMGFIKAQSGNVTINKKDEDLEQYVQYDSWKDANMIQRNIGYVPGEISFPNYMTGVELIKQVCKLRNMNNWEDAKKWIDYWEFNPNMKIKKMSKGMKQKVALVLAWMHNPDIIILDEPTTGLDPLMQEKFCKLVLQSKKEGKAVILSSHIFSEIEKVCDKIAIIKRGKIISNIDIDEIKYHEEKTYEIKFLDKVEMNQLKNDDKWIIENYDNDSYVIKVNNKFVNEFISKISKFKVEYLKEHALSLEEYFMKYYQNEIESDVTDSVARVEISGSHKRGKYSFELIRDTTRKTWKLWAFLTFLPILIEVLLIIIFKKDKGTGVTIEDSLLKMFFTSTGTPFLVMLIYIIIVNNSLVVGEVDKGTMVNLLTTDQSRKRVIISKMAVTYGSVVLSILLFYLTQLLVFSMLGIISQTNQVTLFINLVGLLLLLLTFSTLTFWSSAYFNKSAISLSICGAVSIIFYVFALTAKIGEMEHNKAIENLKYITICTLFEHIKNISKVQTWMPEFLVMGGIICGSTFAAYQTFLRKDLPL